MQCLSIVGWVENYEPSAPTNRLKKAMSWFRESTDDFVDRCLTAYGDEGHRARALWNALRRLHASWPQDRRTGLLLREDGTPCTHTQFAVASGLPIDQVARAIEILTDPDLGCMRWIDVETGLREAASRIAKDDAEETGTNPEESVGIRSDPSETDHRGEERRTEETEATPPPAPARARGAAGVGDLESPAAAEPEPRTRPSPPQRRRKRGRQRSWPPALIATANRIIARWNAERAARCRGWCEAEPITPESPHDELLEDLVSLLDRHGDALEAEFETRLQRMAANDHFGGRLEWSAPLEWLLGERGWRRARGLPTAEERAAHAPQAEPAIATWEQTVDELRAAVLERGGTEADVETEVVRLVLAHVAGADPEQRYRYRGEEVLASWLRVARPFGAEVIRAGADRLLELAARSRKVVTAEMLRGCCLRVLEARVQAKSVEVPASCDPELAARVREHLATPDTERPGIFSLLGRFSTVPARVVARSRQDAGPDGTSAAGQIKRLKENSA